MTPAQAERLWTRARALERMVLLDAGVEDADLDALARRASPRPLPVDVVGPLHRDGDLVGAPGRQAPGGQRNAFGWVRHR